MFLFNVLRQFVSQPKRARGAAPPLRGRSRWHRRPVLEELETRTLPSTMTVLNNHDSGSGSLRAMIAAAQPGDIIRFDQHLHGQTITLTSGELMIDKNLDIQSPVKDRLVGTTSGTGDCVSHYTNAGIV